MSLFRYAGQVSVGDKVLVQGKGHLIPETVINVSNYIMQGDNTSYNFLTVLLLSHTDLVLRVKFQDKSCSELIKFLHGFN